MDELTIQRGPGLSTLIRDMKHLIQTLAEIAPTIINSQAMPGSEAAE